MGYIYSVGIFRIQSEDQSMAESESRNSSTLLPLVPEPGGKMKVEGGISRDMEVQKTLRSPYSSLGLI
jgi:hypothetical protein